MRARSRPFHIHYVISKCVASRSGDVRIQMEQRLSIALQHKIAALLLAIESH